MALNEFLGLPSWHRGKESACQCGRPKIVGSIPGSGRSPGVGGGNPLQHSCLEISMDRGAWWATVLRTAERQEWAMEHTHKWVIQCLPYYNTIIYKMSALRTGVTLQKTFEDDSIIATKFMDNPSLNDCLKIFKISSETEGELPNSPYQSLDHILRKNSSFLPNYYILYFFSDKEKHFKGRQIFHRALGWVLKFIYGWILTAYEWANHPEPVLGWERKRKFLPLTESRTLQRRQRQRFVCQQITTQLSVMVLASSPRCPCTHKHPQRQRSCFRDSMNSSHESKWLKCAVTNE